MSTTDQQGPCRVLVNGAPRSMEAGQTVAGLVERLGLDPERIAIEMDRRILKRTLWAATPLLDGSQLEIVQFVGGG